MKKGRDYLKSGYKLMLAICLCLILMPSAVPSQEAKIKAGVSVSMTGHFANEGALVKKGYEAWAKWVNGRGGINIGGKPHKVEIIFYDDKSDAKTSGKLTEKLITEDKVDIILGPFASDVTAATSVVCERNGYVLIAPFASDIIYKKGFKHFFALLGVTGTHLVPVADLAAKQTPRPKSFAIVVLDHYFPLAVMGGLKKRSLELGFEEVYYGKYPFGTTDFSGILTSIKSKKPDLIYFGGFFPMSVSFYRQAKELKVNAKLYTTTGAAEQPNWMTVMKKDGDYVISQTVWHPDMPYKGPYFNGNSFKQFWNKEYGTQPPAHCAAAFATALLMQIAIEKAGTLDQARIRDILRAEEWETFFGKFKYDKFGKNTAFQPGLIQIQNGKQVLINPPSPGVKFLYPAPEWGERW